MAAAHMAQGSSVTVRVQPISRSLPITAQAARMASSSAWAVGSASSRVRLPAAAMIAPLASVITAPTGTSPRAAAARASSSAHAIALEGGKAMRSL